MKKQKAFAPVTTGTLHKSRLFAPLPLCYICIVTLLFLQGCRKPTTTPSDSQNTVNQTSHSFIPSSESTISLADSNPSIQTEPSQNDQESFMKPESVPTPGVAYSQEVQNSDDVEELKKVAITFDDGPHPVYTKQLLDGLEKSGAKATFFLMGQNVELYPELVERMSEDGHLVGNHTYSHLGLTSTNHDEFMDEISATNELIEEIIGTVPQYLRPPYGTWDKSLEDDLNMFPVLWTIDPLDWCSTNVECITK
ncbi:MAG: polysaccharide deacetylase family protein, partial [Lachnospiraceae bacterium]|nr:polysaccharide deacetylase family protein [Lachnospiraceae bacterium]